MSKTGTNAGTAPALVRVLKGPRDAMAKTYRICDRLQDRAAPILKWILKWILTLPVADP
jgi:hypothetical protein